MNREKEAVQIELTECFAVFAGMDSFSDDIALRIRVRKRWR
ncbi:MULTISPECIES: hypothetical protein [Bacillota]|nr:MULTISPECIES: hypothetical protein [Thomasclavelia]MDU2951878.1 hypothetical protein [[Clostridium] innocuum]MDY3044974.1 hypothetical protein [[Clostridium] innocuum]